MLRLSQSFVEGAEDYSEAAAIAEEERGKSQLLDDRNSSSLDFEELEQRLTKLQAEDAKRAKEQAAAIAEEEREMNQLLDKRNKSLMELSALERRWTQLAEEAKLAKEHANLDYISTNIVQIKEAKQAAEQGTRESKRLTHKAEEQAAEGSVQNLYGLAHDLEQKDIVQGINTFRNEEIWATDSTLREQFSDSGYASMPHEFARKSEFPQNETIMEESNNILAESDHNNNTLEYMEQADDRTEYSAATSLGDSRIEGLVSQLADQLIEEIHLDGLDERSTETVFSTLQDLLKNFALKIGFNAQSQMQRDIMYYTHKYSE
jgi:hypothetical protein